MERDELLAKAIRYYRGVTGDDTVSGAVDYLRRRHAKLCVHPGTIKPLSVTRLRVIVSRVVSRESAAAAEHANGSKDSAKEPNA